MFSNITDAWKNDPIKEITDKITRQRYQPVNDDNHKLNQRDIDSISLLSDLTNDLSYTHNKTIKKNISDSSYELFNTDDKPKNCDPCYYKIKKLIDDKINKKLYILENKLVHAPPVRHSTQTDSWKNTLIIVLGAIIIILIIFLIFRKNF